MSDIPLVQWLTVHLIRNALAWLDHWPAGLKLNTELSRFLCLCFMSLTDIWGSKFILCFVIIVRLLNDPFYRRARSIRSILPRNVVRDWNYGTIRNDYDYVVVF